MNTNLLLVVDIESAFNSLSYLKMIEKQALREQALQLHLDRVNDTTYTPENDITTSFIHTHKPVNNGIWCPENHETPLPLHDGMV